MSQFFLYASLGLLGFGYLCSVLSCMFNGESGKWWESWVMGAILPFWVVYEWRGAIAGVAVCFGVIGAFLWAVVLVADLFRWLWSLI